MIEQKVLEEWKGICEAATKGPCEVGIFDPDDDPVERIREHLSYGSGKVFCVWLPQHPKSMPDPEGRPTHAVLACITGNGPDSEKNAEFYATASTALPLLLKEVEEMRGMCREAAEKIADLSGNDDGELCCEESYTGGCVSHHPDCIVSRLRAAAPMAQAMTNPLYEKES